MQGFKKKKTQGTKFFHVALDLQGERNIWTSLIFRAPWLIYTMEVALVQPVLSSRLQHQGCSSFDSFTRI